MIHRIHVKTPNLLEFSGKTYRCVIGRSGWVDAEAKREGDGATPKGSYALRCCYYRPDRISPAPVTQLPLTALSPDDGWCDDPTHPLYNQPVKLPFTASHEKLWREDHAYDLIIPLGYNDAPIIPGMGSAIFMHLMHDAGTPTAGCVALTRDDVLELLPALTSHTMIAIG